MVTIRTAHCNTQYTLHCDHAVCASSAKTAYSAVRNAAHSLYRGVLYFQNATRFHGTRINVTARTDTTKVRPFIAPISIKFTKSSTAISASLLCRISPKSGNERVKYAHKLIYAPSTTRILLPRLSRNKHSFNINLCTSPLYRILSAWRGGGATSRK